MNKVLDTIIQSCEELGTLQQDGNIFLSPEQIKQCKDINLDLSLQNIEEEYRRRSFTTQREEYIQNKLKIYKNMSDRITELQNQYLSKIVSLSKKEIDEPTYNMEKNKYNTEKERLLMELQKESDILTSEIASRYYNVEQVQYKDLVNRMFRIQELDNQKKGFRVNLDTTEQQLKILIDKRYYLQQRYKMIMVLFILLSIVFMGLFIYYLFSKNTL